MTRADNRTGIRWIVAQEGSRQTYAVPLSFHRMEQLRLMYTDVWCRWGRSLLRQGPAGARALATRFESQIPSEHVVSFNSKAILARSIYHFRRSHLTPAEHAAEFIRFGRWFAQNVRDHLAGLDLDPERDHFFGFNTNSLETIVHLKERGIFTLVDQVDPGKTEEDMVMDEAERWPDWAKRPGRMPESYWQRLRAEWASADLVLVNSEWSKQALLSQGVSAGRIIVVPLAIDLHKWEPGHPIKADGPLKVLWLGSVILRKGIQYLVEAARLLRGKPIEFLLAGPVGVSRAALETFPSNMKMLGRITRDQLNQVYREGHVFVLPTISDGFAITQLEAMARGLPVVTTPNCGDVVTNGMDGLIVPARDGRALADALAKLNDDRQLLRTMSANALITIQSYDLPSNARLIDTAVDRWRAARRVQSKDALSSRQEVLSSENTRT